METLVNFRDLGGMQTVEGLKVRANRLLRAGEVVKLSEEDLRCLREEYQLRKIIDFRHVSEIEEKPDDEIEGATYLHLDIFKDTMKNMPSHEEMMKQLKPSLANQFMKDANRQFIVSKGARQGYQQFFRSCLENKEGALLFHCTAGKDRTGFGAALLLKTLGVRDEDILEDYLKSATQRQQANQQIIEAAKARGLKGEQLEALGMLMTVKREYLEAAFETIKEEYGDFNTYMKDGLEISEQEMEELRKEYLIDALN